MKNDDGEDEYSDVMSNSVLELDDLFSKYLDFDDEEDGNSD